MLLSKAHRVTSLHPEIIQRKLLQHLSLLVWTNLQQRNLESGNRKKLARKIKIKVNHPAVLASAFEFNLTFGKHNFVCRKAKNKWY